MTLFDRSIRVEFSGVEIAPVTDLRIAFKIEKNDGLQFNHGTITIYNLSDATRRKVARPHPLKFPMVDPVITVSLFAGYRGQEVLVLKGDILSAINSKAGPDWLTVIEVFSGLSDSSKADTQVSFSKPTSAKLVADQLLSKLNSDIKYTAEALRILQGQRVNDFATSGMAAQEASVFLAKYGLKFTLEEGGQGLVYVENKPRNPDDGKTNDNTFSPQNGLIGTPQITKAGINIKALLRPRVKLFEKIFVQSRTTTGTLQATDYSPNYHVIGLSHAGDNRGADWFTEIEAVYSSLFEGAY